MHQIEQLKDRHEGKRCFLIGNGPSLCIEDLGKLHNEITFACNNIYLAFQDSAWRPTYYTVSDPLVAKTFAAEIDALSLTKIFSNSVMEFFKDSPDTIWLEQLQYARDDDLSDFAFSFDLVNGVYHGATTLYIQLQVAFYMGISKVYLLGVDFDYKVPSDSGKRSGLGVIVKHERESNHFHSSYRQPGEEWWLPDKDFQYKTYAFARSVFLLHNRAIFNASRKTALDVFPLVDLDRILI